MIRVSEPSLGDRELQNVAECIRSGWISAGGRFVDEFEDRWAAYCGRRYGVAVSNGTTALHLALAALGIGPGDEVILPTFTIISCCATVLQTGATPVLVDADPKTWCMDVERVADRITPRTRAIMPVHIYGHPVDMDPVLRLAGRHNLAIIEDAAEAHGAEYLLRRDAADATWRRCGSFGDMSVFSFYANKPVTTGEGGMIVTDDVGWATRLRSLRNLAFGVDRRFVHEALGFNYRLTNLQAAIGVAQLERIDGVIARKRAVGAAYYAALSDVDGLTLPTEQPWARSIYWMFGLLVSDGWAVGATELGTRLAAAGIETRPFFVGMHEQPVLRRRGLFVDEQYPVATAISRRGLYLPSGVGLTDAQIQEVASAVRGALH